MRFPALPMAALALACAAQPARAAKLVHDSLVGPVTGDRVRYTVALPDDYSPAGGPYPVVYHLHGIGGNERGPQTVSVPQSFEAARAQGILGPVIVVFPDGMVNSFWADTKDGSKRVETHVLGELTPHIESRYAVRTDKGGRFIQGFSMGGFGAAKFMAKFPERFAACVMYDGALLDWTALRTRHPDLANSVFGGDAAYAADYIPYDLLRKNAAKIGAAFPVKLAAGALLKENRAFRDSLKAHGLSPAYSETGCEHQLPCHLGAEGLNTAKLYAAILAAPIPPDPMPAGFTLTGDPRSTAGATWTFAGTRDGVAYDLQGVLFYPPTGAGPFGGAVVSHGKGGNAKGYSSNIAKTLREWGLIVIATNYTHAVGVPVGAPGIASEEGASAPNLLRGRLALDILRALPEVDDSRIAAHGHSMGAFLTGGLVGTTQGFRAATHTAGGVAPKDGFAATSKAQAGGIAVPYQMHHGDLDNTVPFSHDQRLDSILAAKGVTHHLQPYPGYDHGKIALDAGMLGMVKAWYVKHGVLPSQAAFATGMRNTQRPAARRVADRFATQGAGEADALGRALGSGAAR